METSWHHSCSKRRGGQNLVIARIGGYSAYRGAAEFVCGAFSAIRTLCPPHAAAGRVWEEQRAGHIVHYWLGATLRLSATDAPPVQELPQFSYILHILLGGYLVIEIGRYGVLVPLFDFLGHPDHPPQAAVGLEELGRRISSSAMPQAPSICLPPEVAPAILEKLCPMTVSPWKSRCTIPKPSTSGM